MNQCVTNVLALNGSPRGSNSATFKLLSALIEGVGLTNAKSQLITLASQNITSCSGCFKCWEDQTGKCIFHDDMDVLLPLYAESDLIIYGTPVHTFTLSTLLKSFIDRCFPIYSNSLMQNDKNNSSTLISSDKKTKKLLVVANCGFPERDHFFPITDYFEFLANKTGMEYLGAILQPMGEVLKDNVKTYLLSSYYATLRKIGKALVEKGTLDTRLLECLEEHWVINSAADFKEIANFNRSKINTTV